MWAVWQPNSIQLCAPVSKQGATVVGYEGTRISDSSCSGKKTALASGLGFDDLLASLIVITIAAAAQCTAGEISSALISRSGGAVAAKMQP